MGYTWAQLPSLGNPSLADALVVGHEADGNLYQSTIQSIADLIGGGSFTFSFSVDLSSLTIYNFGNFTVTPNNTASSNAAAFTAMINEISNANPQGGEIWIPQFPFLITPGNFSLPTGINMRALGTGGVGFGMPSLDHFQVQGNGTLFNCSGVGGHTFGGVRFENLGIGYSSSAPATLGTSTAIVASTSNIKAVKCVFGNYPCAFVADSLSDGLEQCTIGYFAGPNGTGPNAAGQFAAVVLQAPEVYIIGPGEILQAAQGDPPAPSNTNGIAICGSSENAQIGPLHIQHWSYGVTFNMLPIGEGGTGAKWPHVFNCEIASWITPVYMQPSGDPTMGYAPGSSSGVIQGAKFSNCNISLDPGDAIANTNKTPLVLIDTNATGNNSNIDDVEFTNCSVYNGNQYGYQIVAGQNIRIIGGLVGGNGNSTTNGGSAGAGIAITGTCGNVLISGVDLNAKFSGSPSPNQAQTYAILVTASPTSNITVTNCDMSGGAYSGSPIHVTGAPTNFNMINCPGYNDQSSGIPNGQTINTGVAYQASTAGTVLGGPAINYYGPQTLIFTQASGGTFSVGGAAAFTLSATQTIELYLPNAYTTIQWGVHAPSQVQWVGV